MTKEVEDKIREYYLSEDGEWLVEKGKMREARLLKEAYHRIKYLKRTQNLYMGLYDKEFRKNNETRKTVKLFVEEEVKKVKDELQGEIKVLGDCLQKIKGVIK